MQIRNIAIIAHVDHGKTTLTDALMRQTGAAEGDVSMDSNALEQERGITIYAKNAAIFYRDTKINIVDTPGHADFGSEVERVLRSIDSVLLVVDAQEGPMPQTRFVLKKSLELGLKPIVVINKIDKPAADPVRCEEQVLELFLELGALDEQANFPVVYTIGRLGIAKKKISDESQDLTPLLDTILEHIPSAYSRERSLLPLRLQPFNLGYDNFLGRLAIARVHEGTVSLGQSVFIHPVKSKPRPLTAGHYTPRQSNAGDNLASRTQGIPKERGKTTVVSREAEETSDRVKKTNVEFRSREGSVLPKRVDTGGAREIRTGKITKIFTFNGLKRVETNSAGSGDIVVIVGLPDIDIGETVTTDQNVEPLPAIAVDEPTIALNFLVNNSPFAGREGKFVTSRQLREYLEREIEVNVGLRIDFSPLDSFRVFGRGELHIAILLENMRRSGYELQVSQPQVIIREENGIKYEPFEEVIIDAPHEYQGVVIERLGVRAFIMKDLHPMGDTIRLSFEGPTRGLLGYRNQFVVDTKGNGILSSRFLEFRRHAGEIRKRPVGSMISMANGKALGYALWKLQERGVLYIGPNIEVYEGMVIGNTAKGEEMPVNPTKGKQLTNIRAASSDEAIDLVPAYELTIERGLEIMAEDEYLEITPKCVRLRKQYLSANERSKARKRA